MKKFVLISLLFSSLTAFADAASMICDVQEFAGEQRSSQTVTLEIDPNNSHGSIGTISFQLYPKFNGMIAFMNDFAVISIADSDTGYASSSHGKLVAAEDVAHHQLLLPGSGINGFSIDCKLQ